MLTRLDVAAGPDLWRTRIDAALRFREDLHIDATAMRLVHGEADLLPSLIVDRYGDWLVLQALSQGVDRLMPLIVDCSSIWPGQPASSPATTLACGSWKGSSRKSKCCMGPSPSDRNHGDGRAL